MTPDKAKKTLPSSTSVVFLEQPQTPYEWRYVLKVIKVEHQKGQWKQCLERCDRMLRANCPALPLHTACLHFYAALSEEAIARQMHEMSLAKIQTLQRSRSHFERATLALPIPEKHIEDNESLSGDSGSEVDDTVSLEDSVSSFGGSNQCSVPSSPSSMRFEQQITNSSLQPLPLKVRKFSKESKSSFNEKRALFESKLEASKSSPASTPAPKSPVLNKPLPTPPSSREDSVKSFIAPPQSVKRSVCAITGVRSAIQQRYDEQLIDFAQMLTKHINFVNEAIKKTQEAQALGRRRLYKERKIVSNQADEDVFDLRARIDRMKQRGWVRDRFVPTKYQELCEKALAEL